MNFYEHLIIVVTTLLFNGIFVFFVRNWLLERLKNYIKHGYDVSLENIKTLLRQQADVKLEDYRFQIEIRKKWLSDLSGLSSIFLNRVKEYIDEHNKYVRNDQLTVKINEKVDIYKKNLDNLARLLSDISDAKFQLELLIYEDDQERCIHNSLDFISNWLKTELVDNFVNKTGVDYESNSYKELFKNIELFKDEVKKLYEKKSRKL